MEPQRHHRMLGSVIPLTIALTGAIVPPGRPQSKATISPPITCGYQMAQAPAITLTAFTASASEALRFAQLRHVDPQPRHVDPKGKHLSEALRFAQGNFDSPVNILSIERSAI